MKSKLVIVYTLIIVFFLSFNTNLIQINESAAHLASTSSIAVSEQIYISGNTDFDTQAANKGWPGDGTAGNPYIINNYFLNLYATPGAGAYIENTDRHFIMQNCYWHAPMAWDVDSGGFKFVNVKNGQIKTSLVVGSPDYLMKLLIFPTLFAVWLIDCENITIDELTVSQWYNSVFHPCRFGVAIHSSTNITVKNSNIQASLDIHVESSDCLSIEGNALYGASGSIYAFANNHIPVALIETDYCTVSNNIISNYLDSGVHIEDSDNNVIVENVISSSRSGSVPITEAGTSSGNSYLKINLPANGVYTGPSTPSLGYYPASSYYPAGNGFENDDDGPFQNSNWIDSGTGTGWSSIIHANKSDSYGNNHKKVLACFTGTGSSPTYSISQDTSDLHDSGTVEFWFLKDDPGSGKANFSLIDNSDHNICKIILEDDVFKYTDGSTIKSSEVPVENNKWYRISVDYSKDGLYASLGNYQYRFRVYDSNGQRLFTSLVSDFEYDESIQYFHLQIQGGVSSNSTVYLDALGHYWHDSSIPGYHVGDNQEEGLLISFSLQRMGLDMSRLGYTVNQEPYKYISWDPADIWDPYLNKLVIPIPSTDGLQNISLFFAQTDGEPYYSTIKQFYTFFQTYCSISEYTENGIGYPPGTIVLGENDDLTVEITYTTKDWYYQDTWANASYSFKINDGTWMGPYVFNSGSGSQTANFTINAGNYSIFDNLYYYVILDQYNDSGYSTHLESYYLTMEPVALYYENEARTAAFYKKISPIPYELTLNYSVFYQSEVNATTSYYDDEGNVIDVTTYPYMDILFQNISLDFYNTTAALDEYTVSCYNESLLDHLMAGDTSNITTSTFTYPEGISSPFLLPENFNFTTDPPNSTHINTLKIPAISFSYLPGYNLSFTGGNFTVTYNGTEEWPTYKHTVLKFVDDSNNVVIRYDSTTRIMIYFEYINDTVVNRKQRITIVLIENNASYPINVDIEWYDEIISSGTKIIPDHLLAIVYDPPGDHSFGQITSGTTITKGFSVTKETTGTYVDDWKTMYFGQGSETGLIGLVGDLAAILTEIPGLGDIISTAMPGFGLTPGEHEFSRSITEGTSTDYEFSITYGSTYTSSLDTEDPDLIGPGGGDLYYGTGMIIYWVIKHRVRYINMTTASENLTDQVKLWKGTNWMEYGLAFNSSFTVLGAYLEDYGLGNLTKFNPFLDDNFNSENYDYLQQYQTSTMFWTPDYITELEYSTSQSYSKTYSFTVDISKSDFYCWSQTISASVSAGLGFIAYLDVGAGLNLFESSGRIGWTYEFSMSTISTTATEQNRQTIAHFEDDDGTPVGQHDQFGLQIYRDLRFNTFGYHVIPEFTYTSNPYEYGTRDRRPPSRSEILELNEFIGGDVLLQTIAQDDETGVQSVKIYYDDDPVFNPSDSELVVTLTELDEDSDIYDYLWSTTSLHGTYYLFIVTTDNHSNMCLSDVYQVQIDNVLPEKCQIVTYGTNEGPIALYTNTFDVDSGIAYVEYWNGDPTNQSSSLIGLSSDASTSYRFIWATDPNGTDDGSHAIYARAYDKAGNYRDSIGFSMNVDTYKEPKRSSFPNIFAIIVVMTVLTVYIRKRKKKK